MTSALRAYADRRMAACLLLGSRRRCRWSSSATTSSTGCARRSSTWRRSAPWGPSPRRTRSSSRGAAPRPVRAAVLDRRRGWLLIAQVLLVVAIGAMAALDPRGSIGVAAAVATVVAFLGATQDVAIDAWRTDTIEVERQAAGAASYVTGTGSA